MKEQSDDAYQPRVDNRQQNSDSSTKQTVHVDTEQSGYSTTWLRCQKINLDKYYSTLTIKTIKTKLVLYKWSCLLNSNKEDLNN